MSAVLKVRMVKTFSFLQTTAKSSVTPQIFVLSKADLRLQQHGNSLASKCFLRPYCSLSLTLPKNEESDLPLNKNWLSLANLGSSKNLLFIPASTGSSSNSHMLSKICNSPLPCFFTGSELVPHAWRTSDHRSETNL